MNKKINNNCVEFGQAISTLLIFRENVDNLEQSVFKQNIYKTLDQQYMIMILSQYGLNEVNIEGCIIVVCWVNNEYILI